VQRRFRALVSGVEVTLAGITGDVYHPFSSADVVKIDNNLELACHLGPARHHDALPFVSISLGAS